MPKIFHHLTINTPAAKVYGCISTLDGLNAWWTNNTTGNPAKNGELRFDFGNGMFNIMKVTESIPGKFVSWTVLKTGFTWADEWLGTTITFSLEENETKNIVLKFEHDGWKTMSDFYGNCNFHWAKYLASMKQFCETGKGAPHQAR